ncbi:HER109Wp [Eremothecium sinecaudum]|uniref:rRNA methyltransferase 2, mitochondrial n=1 Tax=Eremothecium sinecaudum TaxID=45286 RepID=A0A109UZP6_9SACH|nr:HER109Wp [Eremothecium sinecaudum]AMD21388.1 HER109Wp [Eremothecium sinecaudum]
MSTRIVTKSLALGSLGRGCRGGLVWCRFNSSARWVSRQQADHYTNEAKVKSLRSRAAFKLMEIDHRFKIFKENSAQKVLDLGFAPGAWSQVAYSRTRPDGQVMGVDILPCIPPKGVSSIQANILSSKTHELVRLYFSRHYQLNMEDDLHKNHGYFQEALEAELGNTNLSKENTQPLIKYPLDVIISDMYEPWPQTTGFWNNFTNAAYHRMANTTGVAIKDHYMSMDLCDAALVCAIDLLKPDGSFVCKLYTGKEDNLLEKRMKQVFRSVRRFKPKASRDESKELYFVGLNKRKDVDKVKVFSI